MKRREGKVILENWNGSLKNRSKKVKKVEKERGKGYFGELERIIEEQIEKGKES